MPLKTLLIISLILTGCASSQELVVPEPVVVTEYVYPDCGNPPQRDHVDLRPVNWRVIDGRFTLSAKGYEDLSYNVSEIWNGVKQLQVEIEYYERCVQPETEDEP